MDRMRTLMTLALALPLIGAVAVGCNTGTEEPAAPESSSEAAATSDSETSAGTATTPEAATAAADIDSSRFPELAEGVEAAVPENFPKDLPMYPGAVPAQGRGISHENSEMAAVQLLTNDTPEQALQFYQDELNSRGWTVEEVEESPERASISVVKQGCKANFLFAASPTGKGTDIYAISTCDG